MCGISSNVMSLISVIVELEFYGRESVEEAVNVCELWLREQKVEGCCGKGNIYLPRLERLGDSSRFL